MKKDDVKREGKYFYGMPNWRKLQLVIVRTSFSYSIDGEFVVDFTQTNKNFPVWMRDIPADAQFFEYESFG